MQNLNPLAIRLSVFDGFFHKLTGVFAKSVTNGTKEVDELVNLSLFRVNKSLKMENPFPNVIESQGNIFPYEDFSEKNLKEELDLALQKLINSKISKK